MHNQGRKPVILSLAGMLVLGLVALVWVIESGSSEAQQGAMHNCPQPGKWAISVWGGEDGTATDQVLATCGEGAADFAYSIDPESQAWLGYFAGRAEISELPTLDNMQGTIAHGAVSAPLPTVTPTPDFEVQDGILLPDPALEGAMSLEEAISGRRSRRDFGDSPLTATEISQILWAGQGITDPEGHRTAPSAGATYPLELYLVAGEQGVEGLGEGVYHYIPQSHSLELTLGGDIRQTVAELASGQMYIAEAPAILVITAEYERTTQVYGDRGVRYVHLEAGHVGQNVALQVEALGLGTVTVGSFSDAELAEALNLPPNHEPLYVMPIGHRPSTGGTADLPDAPGSAAPDYGLLAAAIPAGVDCDVDCNDDVDAVDALFILQYVVRARQASDQCPPPEDSLYLPAGDVHCDGDVDALDGLFVLQHVVGLRPELCPQTEDGILLPDPALEGEMSLEEAILERRSRRDFGDSPLTATEISQILWAGQGITDPEGHRTAPSAGALYPLELYLVAGEQGVEGLGEGVYHYVPQSHSLELTLGGDIRQTVAELAAGQMYIAEAPAILVITAEYERTTQVFGDRGVRYVHLEAGHVGQNVALQVEALGLSTVTVGSFSDAALAQALDLPSDYEPLYVMPMGHRPSMGGTADLPDAPGSAAPDYALLAAAIPAGVIALGAGTWYARKRWLG
jgi:SagB-type dehydrogenase family enzyme